jgi:hypothetical protein
LAKKSITEDDDDVAAAAAGERNSLSVVMDFAVLV